MINELQSFHVAGNGQYFLREGWDDHRYALVGRNLDTSAGRMDYNFTEVGVDFADNARYDEAEQITIADQISHRWKIGSEHKPHLHWKQSASQIPNWLLVYRTYQNGGLVPAVWTLAKSEAIFSYASGTLAQISVFPAIDMSSITNLSAFVEYKLYRDTANTSGIFSGADPLSGNALATEFDVHFMIDKPTGSEEEY